MPTVTVQQAFALALQHHQAGRLGDADGLYRQILSIQPEHAGARHHLGVIAHQTGRHELAVEWIRQALALSPNDPLACSNLGEACRALGRMEEAVASYRRAIELKPDYAEAYGNLGIALAGQGQLDEAVAAFRQALEFKPDYATAHYNLGNALKEQGKLGEAVAAYRRAVKIQPAYPEACNHLGVALAEQGQVDEAIAVYQRALELRPDDAKARNNLGLALMDRDRLEEATDAFRQVIQLNSNYEDAHNHLGVALQEQGRIDEAIAAFHAALQINPNYAGAYNNLASALKERGELDAAIAALRRALQLTPNLAGVHSNLIYMLYFHPAYDHQAITEEHQRWNHQFAEPLRSLLQPHASGRDPDRRLRIGYVSPNFNGHVISHFLTPLLEAHDKAHIEIYCYASVSRPDKVTERMKKSADVWRDALGLGDEALAEQIRADQIDILVDLTLHLANNRLPMFARKPAPIQVAWLGYLASTGLPAMDYRFTDALLEPEGSPWSDSVETPIRLPETWCCFDPINDYPEPGALPALRTGYVTFGSLNNFCKVNEAVLRGWVALLQSVEGSRLLMQCPAGAAQIRVRQWFEAQGIATERIDLVARTATREEFLQLFARIDIGLDPFPYNGGTTTCEALWMGIPVVSLAGQAAVSRAGLSALTNLGLPDLVASSEDDYVRIATQLAHDLPRLAELRATLRSRMQASPLMDAPRFARNIETAYRTMWQHWCAKKQS